MVDIDAQTPTGQPPTGQPPTGQPRAATRRPVAVTRKPAVRLFDDGTRRRASIQFWGNLAAGTELARFEGYTGSVTAGIRIRNAFELGGGFRNTLAEPSSSGATLEPGFIGFGRLGAHLWLDDNHYVAIPLGVDAGGGHSVKLHLRTYFGLRFSPIRNLSIGLFPFNPSFNWYKDDSPFSGAQRWRFPTTLEVGFVF